jgi:drug/metabolite transporter (DMT)-like permease
MHPRSSLLNWAIFLALSLIWGSSFILMKIGLDNQLSPYDIAALRMLSYGLVLSPVAVKAFR